jgi:hypothetical protein
MLGAGVPIPGRYQPGSVLAGLSVGFMIIFSRSSDGVKKGVGV